MATWTCWIMPLLLLGCQRRDPFVAKHVIPLSVQPTAVVAADFDGDGRLDLGIASPGTRQLGILRGDGEGGFSAPELATASLFQNVSGDIPCRQGCLSAGDVNGDGRADIAALGIYEVNVFLSGRSAKLGFPMSLRLQYPFKSTAVVAADFSGDGNIDLAVLEVSGFIALFRGDGQGSFGQFYEGRPAGGCCAFSLSAGDVDGDGLPDLAFGGLSGSGVSKLASFAAPSEAGTSWVALGDFNEDGRADLVSVTAEGSLALRTELGRSPSAPPPSSTADLSHAASAITTADFDGDGHLDVAAAGGVDISVLFGDGHGGLAAPALFRIGRALTSLTAGDFNGDGRADLATCGPDVSLHVLLN